MMADELATLAQALKAGKLGGTDAAATLANIVGPSADLALVVESLQAATAVLRTRAKTQIISDNPLPAPPDVPMYYGGRTELDMTHLLLESIAKLECTESKLALACTCRAWHHTLWHPAFWTAFQLPPFISIGDFKRFLERQPQRFQRTACFSINIGTVFRMSENCVSLLFQMAPKLSELVVSSESPTLGDTFVRTVERAANQSRNATGHASSSTSVPPQPIGKRLKRITFRRVWLSSKSFRSFVRSSSVDAVDSDSDDDGPQPAAQQPAAAMAGSSALRATNWAHSLESITFFNIPPCLQRRETPQQIIYSGPPLERSTCELIQGLGRLTSMRVHNPDAPAEARPLREHERIGLFARIGLGPHFECLCKVQHS